MRIALVLCLVAAIVGCGASAAAPSAEATSTDLKITVWPEGRGEAERDTYTLKCAPARGSLSNAASACTRLLKMTRPFRPVARDRICTDQYGGPQEALVTGTFKGSSVWAVLTLNNGCQISRAKRVGFLLPGFSSGAG